MCRLCKIAWNVLSTASSPLPQEAPSSLSHVSVCVCTHGDSRLNYSNAFAHRRMQCSYLSFEYYLSSVSRYICRKDTDKFTWTIHRGFRKHKEAEREREKSVEKSSGRSLIRTEMWIALSEWYVTVSIGINWVSFDYRHIVLRGPMQGRRELYIDIMIW